MEKGLENMTLRGDIEGKMDMPMPRATFLKTCLNSGGKASGGDGKKENKLLRATRDRKL